MLPWNSAGVGRNKESFESEGIWLVRKAQCKVIKYSLSMLLTEQGFRWFGFMKVLVTVIP
jgi:hypothetical protein